MADPKLVLVSGSVTAVSVDPPAISFIVDESLRGNASGEIRLLVDPPMVQRLSPGSGFLALYTDLVPAPMKPRKMVHAPASARLLAFEGVEISLFRDSAAMRAMLLGDPRKLASAKDYRATVLAGLADADPQMADLWSGELALRAERLGPYTPSEIAPIEALIRSAQHPLSARARLLGMAWTRSPLFGADWYPKAAADIVKSTAVLTRMETGADTLIYTALKILAIAPDEVDAAAVEAWLAAPPILAEAAALALRAKAPALEKAGLDRTLDRALLSNETRAFLQEHRRRLLLQSAAEAGETGDRRSQ